MQEISIALRYAPEVFVDIQGYEGYQVSNLGRVRSLDRFITRKNSNDKVIKGKILTPTLHKKGYYYVRLGSKGHQKHFYIHRLVATAFISNPDNKPQVNHINGNKADNNVCNLEWVTALENMAHAFNEGLGACGERQWQAKLYPDKVKEIRNLLSEDNLSLKEICNIYGVNYRTIYNIKIGRTWKHVA